MVQTYQVARAHTLYEPALLNSIRAFAVLLTIVLLAFVAVYQLKPPDAVADSAPPTEFASGRAMRHLAAIAQKPRPIGSEEHAQALQYINDELRAIGLTPEVQRTTFVPPSRAGGSYQLSAVVQNVVARIEGSDNSKAVLLAAHYDSVPFSPGASDNGTAVAALIEVARALKANAQSKNDVILLFSDCEEIGLYGSKAFVKEHPWAKDVGVVINLEGLGVEGPTILFETSENNKWLVEQFAKACSNAFATSASNDLYRLTPYDTDLSTFKQAGVAGYNFAYINDPIHHHSYADRIENVDERSLQHQGAYAIDLTRHLGNLNLSQLERGNAVYFDILGLAFIHYSYNWAIILAAFALLSAVGLVVLGFRKKRLTVKGAAIGFIALPLTAAIASLAVGLGWKGLQFFDGLFIRRDTYNSRPFMLALVLLAVAITSLLYSRFRRAVSVEDLAIGGLLLWAILTVAASILAPNSSYIFAWPLLFGVIANSLLFVMKDKNHSNARRVVVLTLSAVPIIVLLAPVIYVAFVAMSLSFSWMVAFFVALVLGLFIPHLDVVSAHNKWLAPTGSAVACVALILIAVLTPQFDNNHPRPNNIFYAANADTGKAVWASSDLRPDEWTSKFLSAEPQRGALTEFIPDTYKGFLSKQAPAVSAGSPEIRVLGDIVIGNVRTVRMLITSPQAAPVVMIYLQSSEEVSAVHVDGKRFSPNGKGQWWLDYYAPSKDGIEVVLELNREKGISMRVVNLFYGLPNLPEGSVEPRPAGMMPASAQYSDMTLISRSVTF
ncbi:MAG TPA: M20/M25/M40 family metallo-hydrolase [Blastocatellia bacterium]|nr:M20/M25/M40 family metallo-hydrolase [Blastocatellia bacterium]